MKVITMYLPQFHRVKENDEWWGEGFTEWTTVKGAKKYFETQYQPHIPLGKNYYNLLDKRTMEWQADLMKKYGVDGQCIYHYWFEDGRQILEKPAENLLRWKDIDMPFCFCWANETWARTWSGISNANSWSDICEKEKDKDKEDTGVLLYQGYGGVKEWKRHFDYLLPFFQDDRYIKVNDHPVFVIYMSAQIPCLYEMITKWNEWAREQGIKEIFIIGANSNSEMEGCLSSVLYHQPRYARQRIRQIKRKRGLRLEYDEIWQEALSCQSTNINTIYGGFVGFDDTPRHGKAGRVVVNSSPEKFRQYLSELIAKNKANGNDLIFVNAWNEWGEGMHLEPDERYQYGFLEAVVYAKEHYTEYLDKYKTDKGEDDQNSKREIEDLAYKAARYEGYWKILDAWLSLREDNISIEQYFIKNGIKTVNIYGLGMLGKHLTRELENGEVKVACIIDHNADRLDLGADVYLPEDNFPENDMIVVTVTYAYEEIKNQLQERGYKNIISLEQIIMDL